MGIIGYLFLLFPKGTGTKALLILYHGRSAGMMPKVQKAQPEWDHEPFFSDILRRGREKGENMRT